MGLLWVPTQHGPRGHTPSPPGLVGLGPYLWSSCALYPLGPQRPLGCATAPFLCTHGILTPCLCLPGCFLSWLWASTLPELPQCAARHTGCGPLLCPPGPRPCDLPPASNCLLSLRLLSSQPPSLPAFWSTLQCSKHGHDALQPPHHLQDPLPSRSSVHQTLSAPSCSRVAAGSLSVSRREGAAHPARCTSGLPLQGGHRASTWGHFT